ncbi:uncharacterized protein LOC119742438 isoform X2 [Patiria miniata]|uniref:J domain-containing protein n=1 Tax=Patiria miniata TaxID=46514 RepID=A0A914BEI8_PATMI|nr:uncharacterized protein LOC119742438 isoform X2 [Patiria miniata]
MQGPSPKMPPKKKPRKVPASPPTPRRSGRTKKSPHVCSSCESECENTCSRPEKKPKTGKPKTAAGKARATPDVKPPTCTPTSSYSFQCAPPSRNAGMPSRNAASASTDDQSASAQFRIEGNIMYKKALQEGISPCIKMSRLEDALRLYTRAANLADGPTKVAKWASATKNCGMALKRMAQEHLLRNQDESAALPLFKDSLKQMGHALLRGSSTQGEAWQNKLREEMEASYFETQEIISNLEGVKEKVREMHIIASYLPAGMVQAGAHYLLANTLFKESVRLLESGEYKECLNCLHDLHQPVEEALGFLRGRTLDQESEDLLFEVKVLKKDARYQASSAESIQARKSGEGLLEQLFETEEFIDMDLVWITVDWFKEASLKAAELDLEQEAAALSYLGLINQKILFSNAKAKSYYKRCLELVDAAKPKTFLKEKWYKQCVKGYQRIQDQERWRDEAAQQKIRRKILDGLKDELDALEKANTSASSLMEHLYKSHAPPKSPKFTKKHLEELKKNEAESHTFDLENRKARKKLLLKACQDFHPDKFVDAKGETEDDKAQRKVLMEEITKMITKYYEHLKLG